MEKGLTNLIEGVRIWTILAVLLQTEGLNTRKSVDPKDEDEGRPKITKGPKFLKPKSVEKPRVEERRRNADRLNLYSSTREDGMLV